MFDVENTIGETPVKGQWVFGVVIRKSGRTFLDPVPDRPADNFMNVLHA
jgi:hypothetical protein